MAVRPGNEQMSPNVVGGAQTRGIRVMHSLKALITSLSLAIFLAVSLPGTALANERGTETGDDVAVILDLMVLRPVGLVATVGGVIIFIGSLPISLPTGSVGKAFRALVAKPASYTFWRKLGEEN
jgi:hypothetical protein